MDFIGNQTGVSNTFYIYVTHRNNNEDELLCLVIQHLHTTYHREIFLLLCFSLRQADFAIIIGLSTFDVSTCHVTSIGLSRIISGSRGLTERN